MCTKAPTIGAMLWQNVNRWRKIRDIERAREKELVEKEKNTAISSDFIHVLLVNLILTFGATQTYTTYTYRFLFSYTFLWNQLEPKADCLRCQFEKNFSNITPYFSHWHTRTRKHTLYLFIHRERETVNSHRHSPLIWKWRHQYQWFHLTFNSTLFQ